jgi:histidine kinase/DNA gyrase B/HSP90-like ATPase
MKLLKQLPLIPLLLINHHLHSQQISFNRIIPPSRCFRGFSGGIQPLFTTKPTGEGTGLGLSLAYNIIKAHGGELKVKSKEGEGAAFAIRLPILPAD